LARVGLTAALGLILLLAGGAPTGAQGLAAQTWIAGDGDDASPTCSRAAPCRFFSTALPKTAAGGEITFVSGAGGGPITIDKSISIIAEGFTGGVLVSSGAGIVVNAGPNDVVVLRGLDIEGVGTGAVGIRFDAGRALFVEDSTIDHFAGDGIRMQVGTSARLHVVNTAIRHNTSSGIRVSTTSGQVDAIIDGVALDSNGVGLDVRDRTHATIRNSVVSGNTVAGLQAQAATGTTVTTALNVESTSTSFNAVGIQAGGGSQPSIVPIANVTVNGNGVGINIGALGSVISFGNNTISGNGTDGTPTATVPLQ